MAVRAAVKAVALSGLGATLIGCGGDTTAAPAPAPSPGGPAPSPAPLPWPNSIKAVWDNHFSAFAEGDVDKIMMDYDSESLLAVFNDKCNGSSGGLQPVLGYTEYSSEATIRQFFTELFARLKENNASKTPLQDLTAVGPIQSNGQMGSPSETYASDIAGSSVFLTWRTAKLPKPIDLATDTFTFRKNSTGAFRTWKQNIVSSEPNEQCADTGKTANALKNCTASEPTCKGWTNHFDAFGKQNLDQIMEDYSEDSLVQVYDNNGQNGQGKFEMFKGTDKIKGMFTTLFKDIGVNKSGLDVKVLDVDEGRNTVFLVWTSDSHPKATDSFIFDANGIILTQTIVVSQNASSVEMLI